MNLESIFVRGFRFVDPDLGAEFEGLGGAVDEAFRMSDVGLVKHRVWPENSIRRIPSSTKGYISVRNFGICESASVPETPRIKQETPKSWTRRIPPATLSHRVPKRFSPITLFTRTTPSAPVSNTF